VTQTPEPTHDRVRVGATRRYDSPLRRERAAQTRDSIISAGAELVHEFSSWDWRKLTIRAVAERAGVHERTVYRHPTHLSSLASRRGGARLAHPRGARQHGGGHRGYARME